MSNRQTLDDRCDGVVHLHQLHYSRFTSKGIARAIIEASREGEKEVHVTDFGSIFPENRQKMVEDELGKMGYMVSIKRTNDGTYYNLRKRSHE